MSFIVNLNEELRAAIKAARYSVSDYDLVGAAPELACALHAKKTTLTAPVLDVLATASHREIGPPISPRRWAWIGLVVRDGNEPAVVLVTASQPPCTDARDRDRSLTEVFDLFVRAEGERESVRISSGLLILPMQTAQITVRSNSSFRPHRFFVSAAGTLGGAADWLVNDIQIGNRSQFNQEGGIPGDMFSSGAIDTFVSFEKCQPNMDIRVTVTYVGTNSEGELFHGAFVSDPNWRANTIVTYHQKIADAVLVTLPPLQGQLAEQLGIRV